MATELRTIFQTISLHDTLELEVLGGRGKGAIEFRVTGNPALATEAPQKNLVYRALHALRREMNWRRAFAPLTKRIPAGRGLGGGSSDAAAALIALLR